MRPLPLIVALLVFACAAQPLPAQLPAFPGAEGAGAMSLGGRGGRVFRVTNLNDGGPGSLRDAVEADGPRTIVFDIGGTIRLQRPLIIRNPRVTIAGQTAPGGGITLRDHALQIRADDVVIRFIRSRLGDQGGADEDAISVISGHRIILDHVSASWGTDETLSSSPNWRRGDMLGDVTVQWSIISESLCKIVGPTHFRHCFGSLVGEANGGRATFHHNLWAHHGGRMPRPANEVLPAQDPEGGFLDFRSNVFYNWGGPQVGYNSGPPGKIAYNFINNSYVAGPDSKSRLIFDERDPAATGWFSGNAFNGAVIADQWGQIAGSGRPGFRLTGPVSMPRVTTDSAAIAFSRILAHAGASLTRDAVDTRVIESVKSRGGRLIDSQADVGGWPGLAPGRSWVDRDRDGIPDDWERTHGLNPRDPGDGARPAADGYTNLEHWLTARAAPAMGL